MRRPCDDALIDAVKVTDVTSYLTFMGWTRRAHPRPEVIVFEGPPDDRGAALEAVIPATTESPDFRDRLVDLLRMLAVVERRPTGDILTDLAAADAATGGHVADPASP